MTSSTTVIDSGDVHSSSPLAAANQVQGAGYSESEVETNATDLKLGTNVATLELEMDAAALKLETHIYSQFGDGDRCISRNIKVGEVFS
jgi:hypothetical protein